MPPKSKLPADRKAPEGTLLLTEWEVATELRIGITKTRRLIREGRIPSVRIDGHRRIRRTALQAYLERLEDEPPTFRAPTNTMPSAANDAWRAAGETTRRRVVEYRAAHPNATPAEVASALGVSKSTVYRLSAA